MNTRARYLASSEFVDWEMPAVQTQARELAAGAIAPEDIARRCFLFVRDEIQHSVDFQRGPVTCRASEVLRHGTGYCYAKSHLLAALLRANGIPAALCYQRLSIADDGPPFCLHGLNAVYLASQGWYRIDARGNKPGAYADFTPPQEQLAFRPASAGEADLPGFHAAPLQSVLNVLTSARSWQEVLANLPDVAPRP
jgi:transglutaminase-like putative cysteine protease